MKLEILILAVSGFFIANTYYDGNYIKILQSWQKYFKMIGFAFAGLSIYLYLKKNPTESHSIVQQATNIIKHMPSGQSSLDMFSPFIDFTNQTPFVPGTNGSNNEQQQINRIMESGKKRTKRCVSETKKKFVASQQKWACAHCSNQLDASFEVDHIIELQNGGTNHVDNLTALCRNCHGKKTAYDSML